MQLREAQLAFKFAGGVETKMDPKAVPAVRLLDLQNGVFTKAVSIKKRNGYSLVSRAVEDSASLVSGALKLGVRDNELLLFTDRKCYSKKTTDDFWTDAGACIAAIGRDRPAVHTGTAQTMPDHASNGGVTAYAWEDSLGGVWWTVVDATSGRVYRPPTQANAGGQRPRCVAVGSAIHIYFVVPAQHFLYTIVVNPSSPSAAVAPVLTLEDIDTTNPVYDAVPTDRTGTPSCIAWHEHATTNVRVGYIDASGALGSPATGHPSVYTHAAALSASSPLAVTYSTIALGIAYQTGANVNATIFDAGLTGAAGTQTVTPIVTATRIAMAFGARQEVAWVAAEETAAVPSQRYCITNYVTSISAGAPQTIRSVGLASRAFALHNPGPSNLNFDEVNDAFAIFVHDTTYFNTYVTMRLSDFAPVGRQLAAQAAGAPTRSHLSSVHVDDDVATVVLPYKQRVSSTNNDQFGETALRKLTLDFSDPDTHQTAQIGRGLYLAAACPQHYDGRQWTEQGFHFGPEYVPTTPANGGSLTVNSRYRYTAWYEWTDAQGEVHRGPTSVAIVVDTGATDNQVTLTLPTLRVTRKSNVRICVARSLPGDTSRLWRVTSLDPTLAGAAANGYVANNTTVDSVSFIDRMSDTQLQLQEPVYTNGGILSNDPCSLGSIVAAGKNRLFFTDASDGSVVRFSQRIASGYGAEIPPELAYDVDPYGGDVTALAVMDDVVYAFKAGCIFAFNGDGPAEDGSNAGNFQNTLVTGFSASQIITSDVGCTDPSSIVRTPEGLMFKSAKGIWLLSRGRQVSYVGAPVEAYNSQAVRRATVLPDRTGVVFLTDSGSTLYYDYQVQFWSRFTNHEGLDAAVVGDTYHYLRTDDVVFRETPGEYSDGGSRIPLVLVTAHLHMHEHLQGFQRFWYLHILGTWVSPHQLGVSYRVGYEGADTGDAGWNEPTWLDATGGTDSDGWLTGEGCMEIGLDPLVGTAYGDGRYGDGVYGGQGDDVYRWRFGIHEEGESIQFRFEDFEKAGLAGASFELTEMKITGGAMPDPAVRPARSM